MATASGAARQTLAVARAALRRTQTSFPMCYGREFIAASLRKWIGDVGSQTAYIEPGSPWENGYCESFNSKLRDELLDGEIFFSLAEARILIEAWRVHYNTLRPHSSLDYRPPAPEAIVPRSPAIVPWASAFALNGTRSSTRTMALTGLSP